MVNIAMRSQGALDRGSLSSINAVTHDAVQAQTVQSLNSRKGRCAPRQEGSPPAIDAQATQNAGSQHPPVGHAGSQIPPTRQNAGSQATPTRQNTGSQPTPARQNTGSQPTPTTQAAGSQSAPVRRPVPPLRKPVRKGQKTALESQAPLHTLKACLGWNTATSLCDVDVSAFLLDSAGKVPGDEWFVFYGQTESPDHSTVFRTEGPADRESITIRLDRLNPSVKKIVFVLTIHEALEKKLHFGMVQDAYIRILNEETGEEMVSFQMDEYYTNVISMMIGEIYLHNGSWKFNAVGNGVAKDLSGLCGLYGVQVEQ